MPLITEPLSRNGSLHALSSKIDYAISSRSERRHSAERGIKKLLDADTMLTAGKNAGAVLQARELERADSRSNVRETELPLGADRR